MELKEQLFQCVETIILHRPGVKDETLNEIFVVPLFAMIMETNYTWGMPDHRRRFIITEINNVCKFYNKDERAVSVAQMVYDNYRDNFKLEEMLIRGDIIARIYKRDGARRMKPECKYPKAYEFVKAHNYYNSLCELIEKEIDRLQPRGTDRMSII